MRIFKLFLLFYLFINSIANAYTLDFFNKFNDKYLEEYIKQAYINNHQLKQANCVLEQYKYQINKQFAKQLPSASLDSNYLGVHFPNHDTNIFVDSNQYILPLSLSYEADLLLKNRDKTKVNKKLYNAQIKNTETLYIALLSEVATCYVNLLLTDYLINNQMDLILDKIEKLSHIKIKLLRGVITSTEVNDIKYDLDKQKIKLDELKKRQKLILDDLALLTANSADNTESLKRGKLEDFEFQENIEDIINTDLLFNRPDIKEIEEKIKAAKIDVTIAKKDFLPRFNITGLLAFSTVGVGNFFSWGSSFAYLLAGLTQDIFSGGEKLANLKIKKAKYKELIEEYQQVDLKAIKEFVDVMNLINKDTNTEKLNNENLSKKIFNLNKTENKFKRGVVSKIEYLDFKNLKNQEEQTLAYSKANRLIDYFSLYKVLGGAL